MDANQLPSDYQDQIAAFERKQKLAQMMFQNAMGFQGAQKMGPVASRTSPLAWLANAGAAGLSAYQEDKASKGAREVRSNFSRDQNAAIRNYLSLSPEQQQIEGFASRFPGVRDIAKTLMDRNEKRLSTAAPLIAETDPTAALGALRTGQLPETMQPPRSPEFGSVPGPGGVQIPTVTNFGKGNRATAAFGPGAAASTTVSLNGPADYKSLEENWSSDLKTRREVADTAQKMLGSSRNAVEALRDGAQAGGLEGFKQTVRKIAQGFGISNASTAPTEQLTMAIGDAVLEDARKLAPVTEVDLAYLKELNGTLSSDPLALSKMLAYRSALAMKALTDFDEFVGSREGSIKGIGTPELRDRLGALVAGQRVGREPPKTLFGPQTFQIEMARQLGNMGYNVDNLNLPDVVKQDIRGGNMRVDLGGAFPTNQRPGAVAPQPTGPKPATQMTPAERRAEIERLKKELPR